VKQAGEQMTKILIFSFLTLEDEVKEYKSLVNNDQQI